MPKYEVHMHKVMCVDIEADSEEDARDAAWEHWSEIDSDTYLNIECPDDEKEDDEEEN